MTLNVSGNEGAQLLSAQPSDGARHMQASDYVAWKLAGEGVTHVFELVGGMITHLLDALHRHGGFTIVSMHHEQGAGFAAEGMGRATGIPGVAMATSGPGATNLLTAIGSCHFDSTAAVFITGQVNRHEQKGARAIRQLGFQETDIVSMATPIVKEAIRIRAPEELPGALERAFRLARSGRPGPVLIDIPMDVQRMQVAVPPPPSLPAPPPVETAPIQAIVEALQRAERPLILVGGGVRSGLAVPDLLEVLRHVEVPVVHSLMAVDVLPWGHRSRIGMIGSYGNRWANIALARADLLVVIGSRLDVRQTGSEANSFRGDRTIYHVDCESAEINNRVLGCVPVNMEVAPFLRALASCAVEHPVAPRIGWMQELAGERERWPDTSELAGVSGINPNVFMHQLSQASHRAAAFVVDVGQHQMWAAQSLELRADQRFMTSGGMGAMGFALPAAIGTAMGSAPRPVVVIAGDGAFQLNIQELETLVRNRLPLKIVVINNECHGMVRQFQQSYFDERYQSTYWGYSAPNFTSIARAYGIAASVVTDEADVEQALRLMWDDPAVPYLLEVKVDMSANVYPKLAFGRPITEMEPFAKPIDMEGT